MDSKEPISPSSSLTLWRAIATMDSSSVARKPMRGGPATERAKARGDDPRREQKAERGTAGGCRVKSLRRERTFQMHKSRSHPHSWRGVAERSSSELCEAATRECTEQLFLGAVRRCRFPVLSVTSVLRSVCRFHAGEWGVRLKGQCAVKAVAATGRGKPLRVSTPWTDSTWNKVERTRVE